MITHVSYTNDQRKNTKEEFQRKKIERIRFSNKTIHPLHSPNIVPYDNHLFKSLQSYFDGLISKE